MAKKDVDEGVKVAPTGTPLPPEIEETEVVEEAPKTVKVGDREYSSLEDLAKDHENLQKLYGDHTGEVGSLRATNKVLTDQIETVQKDAKDREEAGKPPATDYEAQLAEIYKDLNAGDLSVEDAMQKSNALTAEVAAVKAAEVAAETLESTLQERDAQAIQKDFLKEHPDFEKLRNSGKLAAIIKESAGMHDDFSAYFALKATTAREEGKAEAAKLAAGDEATKTVLTKPGESIQQANKPMTPLSESETEGSMLAALKGTSAGEG